MSIDRYDAEFYMFSTGTRLWQCPGTALQNHFGMDRIHRLWRAVFVRLWGVKKYLNNRLDFFKKLVSVHSLKKARSGLTGRFHSGESSICQSGTLQYETMKNF